jgi:hypothetical protein
MQTDTAEMNHDSKSQRKNKKDNTRCPQLNGIDREEPVTFSPP